jgi:hypothetical protein
MVEEKSGAQDEQVGEPAAAMKVPAAHCEQTETPALEEVPGAQFEQIGSPAAAKPPAAHC